MSLGPTEDPSYLLIGELLSPNKQVDSREASASAEEGGLHALVRISETQQQISGGFFQWADNGFFILRLMESFME